MNCYLKKSIKKKRQHSFILSLAIITVTGCLAISLVKLQININSQEKAVEQAQAAYEQQLAENEELKAMMDGDSDELIERVARENGYMYPDEKLFIASSSDE